MSKRNFSFLVIGAVAALGLACEPTGADIDSEIAVVEADQAYLEVEMSKVQLFPPGMEGPRTTTELTCNEAILKVRIPLKDEMRNTVLPPCNGLLQEWEELRDQLNVLPRERVQAQLRERERE